MIDPPHPPGSGGNKLSAPPQTLDAIDEALSAQLDMLAREDFDGVQTVAGRIDGLLGELRRDKAVSAESRRRLADLRQKHNLVMLAAMQKRQEIQNALRKLRDGKGLVRAYKR